MLDFTDVRWEGLHGGYRCPYDPRPALRDLERGRAVEQAWKELWNELHHQGDVDQVSYATVPHLLRIHRERDAADWNTFALVICIEFCRRDGHNPGIIDWLEGDYRRALHEGVELARQDLARSGDHELIASAIAMVALGRGLDSLARLAFDFDEDERAYLLNKWYEGL